jgi:molecular chaperone GrpE
MSEENEQETPIEEKSEERTPVEETVAPPEEIDFEEKYLRLLAELENTRKRMQKEKQQSVRFAIENAISEFLPIMDNFENALTFAKDNTSKEVQNWASGFQMILTQFQDLLHNHGIVAFHSEGNQYDPHSHEAVEIVETEEHTEGLILKEFAKGYKSQQRTIRPAKVKVAKKPAKVEQQEDLIDEENFQTKEQ